MTAERAPRRALTTVKPSTPTKLPTRTVYANDLVFVVDGEEYRPHAGEAITFRGGHETVQDAMLQLKAIGLQSRAVELAQQVQASGDDDNATTLAHQFMANRDELEDVMDQGMRRLLSRIVSWTWTDPNGQPYTSPPTAEILLGLEQEEIDWIKQKASGKTPDPLVSTDST